MYVCEIFFQKVSLVLKNAKQARARSPAARDFRRRPLVPCPVTSMPLPSTETRQAVAAPAPAQPDAIAPQPLRDKSPCPQASRLPLTWRARPSDVARPLPLP